MSELFAPMQGASYEGLIRIEALGPTGQITLRGDFASESLRAVVGDWLGLDLPAPRSAAWTAERAALWMSPDELLLVLPYAQATASTARLTESLAGEHALVANVSDARAQFRLTGDPLREALAKLTPADVSEAALPVGGVRRTRLAQVAAGIWIRDEDEAQLFCFRSVADYTFKLLSSAAAPGSAVGYF